MPNMNTIAGVLAEFERREQRRKELDAWAARRDVAPAMRSRLKEIAAERRRARWFKVAV